MDLEVATQLAKDAGVPRDKFLKLGDQLIGLANHHANQNSPETVHFAFLYAVARYGVFARPGGTGGDNAAFIDTMVKRYEMMLREQLGDPNLKPSKAPEKPQTS